MRFISLLAVVDPRFDGTQRLYGRLFWDKKVTIVGLGGVGSWTAEALARSGVGHLKLIDLDEICSSNCNRQIHALTSTVGQAKAEVLATRCRDISPSISVEPVLEFIDVTNTDLLFPADVVIDAVDVVNDKAAIFQACQQHGTSLVIVGAAGGKTDPTRVRLTKNLQHVAGDKLLRKLRRDFHLTLQDNNNACIVVFSEEPSIPPPKDALKQSGCDQAFGTAAFATAAFGLAAAKASIDLLLAPPSSSDDFIELDCPCSDFDS